MQAPFISLGSEQLSSALLQEVDVVQRLNDHWTCRIVLRDTPDRRPPVEDYAGKELKITTTELDGSEAVVFHGLVRGMRLIYEVTGAWGAELDAVSATWTMAQGTRLKYFRQQSAQATASTVLSNAGLQLGGAMPGGATLSYVQWDETDYHFFSRLVDDAEAWFRPAVDGSGGVDVETAFQAGTTVNWREGEYGLLEWTTQGLLQPVTASGANYDPQKMTSTVVTGTGSSVGWYGGAADKMVAAAQAASASVEPAWVDRHRAATLDDLDTRMQREARRGIANTVRCTGISRNPRVRAGDTLAVTGLPGVDATYGVIEVRHVWSTQGYENHFTVTPAQRWSPPARPARPQLDGVYPARVVDNHDPHNQGRVRVQYYWQEDNQSTWVRLLTPHAGAGRGTLFLPEVGDEVLVTFEEGDAERPYVVGSAWNGVHQPPATGFHSPGETNGSEFEKNYIKRIVTKSGHRITLVDTPGKETISIATPTSNRLMLTESHADTGNRPAIVLESAGDIIMAAPNGRIHTQSMHRSAEVGVTGAAGAAAAAALGARSAGKKLTAKPAAKAVPAPATPAGKDSLCLGKNAQYADAMNSAAKRTGTDPAALAGFVNAEAAKDSNGVWKADSANDKTSATGLMQFLSGTWKGMATTPGTALNASAVQQGLVTGTKMRDGSMSYSTVTEQEGKLLAMRNDPGMSLTTGAEYLKQNEDALAANGLIPANATDADKVQLGYLAHHEGAAGAAQMLQGKIPDSKLDTLMSQNMSKAQQLKYLKANGNDKQAAYRSFVKDVAKQKTNPDRFRCSKQQQLKQLTSAQDAARTDPKNFPNKKLGTTYCNIATTHTLEDAGAPTGPFVDKNGTPLLANKVSENLASSSQYAEVTPDQAQAYANNGGIAVGAYDNPGGHGHLVTVRPDNMVDQPAYSGSGPLLNNIGSKVGVMHASQVFRPGADVHYYVPSGGASGQ